jgi:hypothetical protein
MSYTCELCDFVTDKQFNYQRHLTSTKHTNMMVGIKPRYCAICDVQFSQCSGLVHHRLKFHPTTTTPTNQTQNPPIKLRITVPQQSPNQQPIPVSNTDNTHHTSTSDPHQNITNQEHITVDSFIALFPNKNPSTTRRYYYDFSNYFDKKMPFNWKDQMTHNVGSLIPYARQLNPSSNKRFLQAIHELVPELQNEIISALMEARERERIYLSQKKKPTEDTTKSKEYIDLLFTIVQKLYTNPFRFMEVWTAKVKRPNDTQSFEGLNYYDMTTHTFHINADKVSKFYSESNITFDDELSRLLQTWFEKYNKTDNFLLSVKGAKLTQSSLRYILNQIEVKPTTSRKIYANKHKDEIDDYQKMRHTVLTHETSYVNPRQHT